MQFSGPDRLSSNKVAAPLLFCCLLITAIFAHTQEKPTEVPPDPQGAIQEVAPDKAAVPQTPPPNPAPEKKSQSPGENSTNDTPPANAAKSDQPPSQDVKLGAGDLIEVNVYGVPELNTKARVSNDGNVYLPLIDNVHVADLSLEEAQKLIEERLDDGGSCEIHTSPSSWMNIPRKGSRCWVKSQSPESAQCSGTGACLICSRMPEDFPIKPVAPSSLPIAPNRTNPKLYISRATCSTTPTPTSSSAPVTPSKSGEPPSSI